MRNDAHLDWRAIFAGTFIALLVYLALMALGAGIMGASAARLIDRQGEGSPFGFGSLIWGVASTGFAVFVGALMASRLSTALLVRRADGRAQGVVVAAVFFVSVLVSFGGALGALGRNVGSVSAVAGDPRIQELAAQAMDGATLRAPMEVVAQGLIVRLIRGDEQDAVTFLSRQTGMTLDEATVRFESIRTDLETVLRDIGASAARGISLTGWGIFASILLGIVVSAFGGHLGLRGRRESETAEDISRRPRAA